MMHQPGKSLFLNRFPRGKKERVDRDAKMNLRVRAVVQHASFVAGSVPKLTFLVKMPISFYVLFWHSAISSRSGMG